MILNISLFFISIVTFAISDYLFCQINEIGFRVTTKNILLYILFSIIWISLNNFFTNIPRLLIFASSAVVLFYTIHKKSWTKNILAALMIFITNMIAETIFVVVFVHIFNISVEIIEQDMLGMFMSNFITLSLVMLIINIKYIKKKMINIITWYDEKKTLKLTSFIIIAYGLIAYFTYLNFTNVKTILYLIGVNVILIAIFIFVLGYYKEKAENNKLLVEYDRQMNYVKTYEQLAHDKQKEQHEYRNQLSLIRSMVKSKDNKVVSYIDKLLKIDGENQSHQYFEQLTNIPSGGLKGFILFKINEMINLDIEVVVNVVENLNEENCWKVCDKELTDVSRAIGVYLDNAKEAASLAKQKFIIIDVEQEGKTIVFTISNTFNGNIDLAKIGQDGYSTKGNDHGHGLALIKEIVNKNKHLEQEKEINGIYYVQKLIIK